jgi:CRP/FNR family transcriptional regulator, anaerobic regulatory protein
LTATKSIFIIVVTLMQYIDNYTHLTEIDWQLISQSFVRREIRCNEIIVSEGSVCRYFYFLEKGLVRYFFNNDGIEVTKFFTIAPYCFTSKDSFREQLPAKESIEALDNCIVWQINHQQSDQLLKLSSWNDFTRKFMHEVQSHFEQQLLDVRSITAEQRYLKLLDIYPGDIDKIPLKHLSSYLGIAPQSLSRIRKKRNV